MAITIYHNPLCSKSRETLGILSDHQAPVKVINYLETPPKAAELTRLIQLLGISARELIRTGETEYQELDLADPTLDDDTLIEAMARHPILIQRPVVVKDNRAIIGRPPQKVLELL